MTDIENIYRMASPIFTEPTRVLIVASPYHKDIAADLVKGAVNAIVASGATYDEIEVPNALDIPSAIRLATAARYYDGFVALGCVIRGETTHFKTICRETAHALTQLSQDGICVGNGILATRNYKQAVERADCNTKNRGGDAAISTLHLIAVKRRFTKTRSGRISPSSEHILMAGDATKTRGNA